MLSTFCAGRRLSKKSLSKLTFPHLHLLFLRYINFLEYYTAMQSVVHTYAIKFFVCLLAMCVFPSCLLMTDSISPNSFHICHLVLVRVYNRTQANECHTHITTTATTLGESPLYQYRFALLGVRALAD